MRFFFKRLIDFKLIAFLLFVLFISNLYSQNTIFTSQLPSNSGTDGDYELGTKFTTSQFAEITAIRFYKMAGEHDSHIGNIWLANGTKIASVTFTNESASGWQTADLSPSIFIYPGTVYIVSVNVNFVYPIEQYGLSSVVTNGILSTVKDDNNGVFNETKGLFPAQSYRNSNYFVDVSVAPLNTIFTTQEPISEFDDGPYELGVKFTLSQAAKVKYIRYYKTAGESGIHIGNLWKSDGTLITSVQFSDESTSPGWQYAKLSTQVNLEKNTIYVVSVNSNYKYAASAQQALALSVINGILSTVADGKNGVYSGSPNTKGVFPTSYYNNVNYFRDIVVEPIVVPSVPVLQAPSDNAAGVSTETTLSWSASSGVSSYTLQVAKDVSFSAGSIVLNQSNITANSFTLKGLLNDQIYYWRVSADNNGVTSGFSAPFKFSTVQLANVALTWPIGGAIVYSANPMLSWYVSQGGSGWKYDLLYSVNQNMSSATVISNLTLPQYTLSNLILGTEYYWQIRLKTSSGAVVSYSSIEKFQVFGKVAVPIISWPLGDATVYTLSPTLYWYLSEANTNLTYEVEIRQGETSVLTGNATHQNITGLSLTVNNLLSGTKYSWQVRSKSGSDYSAWSVPASFNTVTINSVEVPTPSWPVGYPIVYTTSPSLYWYITTPAAGLTYQVEYVEGLNTAFSGIPNITNINGLSIQLRSLKTDIDYKWRVRSTNGAITSEWSSVASFRVYAPAILGPVVPTLNWPIGGAAVYSSSVQLNWYLGTLAPVGMTYEVEYGTGTLTGNPQLADVPNLYTQVSQLQSGVTYNWRVRSKLGTAYSEWSKTETFTTVNNAPVATTPIALWPIGGTTVYTNSPLLSWSMNSSTVGLTYVLQYSTSSTMDNPVTITGLNSMQYQLKNLTPGATYYWRVCSFDGMVYSSYCSIVNFVTFAGNAAIIPVAGSPASGVTISTDSPLLSWYIPTSGDVQSYEVQYSTCPDMSLAQANVVSVSSVKINVTEGNTYFWRVRSRNSKGEFSKFSEIANFSKLSVTHIDGNLKTVTSFNLAQNFPNPFNPSTTIEFDIPVAGLYTLKIYDILGQEVATLLNKEVAAGMHSVSFNAGNLTSGTYIYRLYGDNVSMVKKMLLMK